MCQYFFSIRLSRAYIDSKRIPHTMCASPLLYFLLTWRTPCRKFQATPLELRSEHLVCYSNKIKSVCLRIYVYVIVNLLTSVFSWYHTNEHYKSFTHKMAAKTSRHKYGTKLRHCHPMYRQLPDRISRITDGNFTVRMLYCNIYWHIYFRPALCFILVYDCGLTVRNKRICYFMLYVSGVANVAHSPRVI